MSVLVALLSGVLAFLGAVVGHFVAFDLNSNAKRRDVRRTQIERMAEFLSEDVSWTDTYSKALVFGEERTAKDAAPYDKAFAIYVLYFGSELRANMEDLVKARHEYIKAIDAAHIERLDTAFKNKTDLATTRSTDKARENVLNSYKPYYRAILACLLRSSEIVEGTIPAQSTLRRAWSTWLSKLSRRK